MLTCVNININSFTNGNQKAVSSNYFYYLLSVYSHGDGNVEPNKKASVYFR